MFSKKNSKVKKMRGTNSHGWGHKKKHRGAGSRGGVGLSGTGARGDTQKAGLLAGASKILNKISARRGIKVSTVKKELSKKKYFGKKGFTKLNKKSTKTLSLREIEENFELMVEKGLIAKDKTNFILDLTKTKYEKIVGRGKFTKKIHVICEQISQASKAQIESTGGKVELVGVSEEIAEVKEVVKKEK